jgi:hypothetical protein
MHAILIGGNFETSSNDKNKISDEENNFLELNKHEI